MLDRISWTYNSLKEAKGILEETLKRRPRCRRIILKLF
jgi:hypothetical protein